MEFIFECVGVGGDNQLWHTIRDYTGTWSQQFGLVEDESGGGPVTGFAAAAGAGAGDAMQLVGLGIDGRLWHTIRSPDGSWQPVFGSIQDASGGGPASYTAVACGGTGNDLHVVGVGADGHLWHTIRHGDGRWSKDFGDIGAQSAGGPPGFSAVGCAGTGEELQVVGVGTDGQLWHTLRHHDGSWQQAFGKVEDESGGGASAYTAVACGGIGHDLHVIGLGNDSQLWHTIRHPHSWQHGFGPVSEESTGGPGGWIGVSCAGVGTMLEIAAVGTDRQLWHTIRYSGSWQPHVSPIAAQSGGGALAYGAVAGSSGIGAGAPASWLLDFTDANAAAPDGDGRPWGDGTAMAQRAYAGQPPWDAGNAVTPMVGGYATMNAICTAFEAAIADAQQQASNGVPPGQRGHVYIADWQLNALRDMSIGSGWQNSPWNPASTVARDQTALGFVIRMMSAGIVVNLMLWMPTTLQRLTMTSLADEHWSVAAAVQDHNAALQQLWSLSQPIGVACLDLRTAAPVAAALHQKAIVIRVGQVNMAFCGGVDLAYDRRDYGQGPMAATGSGDWQSGGTIPLPAAGWPKQSPPPAGGYPAYPYPGSPLPADGQFPDDLPANVYGPGYRHWHDHHLQLSGPVVATLEQQFAERWIMDVTSGRVYLFDRTSSIGGDNQVQLTSSAAFANGQVLPLPAAQPLPPAGSVTVQMWRTIPLRPGISVGPFVRGEFTVLAGVANAVCQATELITIWDQYFWSEPLARLLAARMMANPSMLLLIVLPPYGTTQPAMELMLRKNALQDLWNGLDVPGRARVAVLDMWSAGPNTGVYVHAKTQTYDDQLLVCGSANMNRRSTECDAELDCAVLDQVTVATHLANLYSCVTGQNWNDTAPGWLARYWTAIKANCGRALIPDPFFTAVIGSPATPNGVPMPYSSSQPVWLYEPTSIGPPVESSTCQFSSCPGDPDAPGRLDEVTFLLEHCYQGTSWPWRQPATSSTGQEAAGIEVPRLVL
jgi:phosphatidylserine/phosphatidylglycerophosphate/cardiolipin synthase-like enzyme